MNLELQNSYHNILNKLFVDRNARRGVYKNHFIISVNRKSIKKNPEPKPYKIILNSVTKTRPVTSAAVGLKYGSALLFIRKTTVKTIGAMMLQSQVE